MSSRGSVPRRRAAASQHLKHRRRRDFEAAATNRAVQLPAYRLPIVDELPAPRVAASRTDLLTW
jgi:hypothetical protein